jgi:hypothetical protein
MMPLRSIILCCAVLFSSFAIADTAPPEVTSTGKGLMFCEQRDHLQEYIQALMKKDQQWVKQLSDCIVFKPGLKVAVIEDFPNDSSIGHIAKVRVFVKGSSIVGFALLIDGVNY